MALKRQSDGGEETGWLGWGTPNCQHALLSRGISLAVRILKALQDNRERGSHDPSCRHSVAHHDPQLYKPLQSESSTFYQKQFLGCKGVTEVIWESKCSFHKSWTNPHFLPFSYTALLALIPQPFQIPGHNFSFLSLASSTASFSFNFPRSANSVSTILSAISFQSVVDIFPVL